MRVVLSVFFKTNSPLFGIKIDNLMTHPSQRYLVAGTFGHEAVPQHGEIPRQIFGRTRYLRHKQNKSEKNQFPKTVHGQRL